jgi:glucose/arabinose dehydrogenase
MQRLVLMLFALVTVSNLSACENNNAEQENPPSDTSAADTSTTTPPPQGTTKDTLPDGTVLTLPAGFQIDIYAADVRGARSMVRGPQGTIFVGTRGDPGKVYALRDEDGDHTIDKRYTIDEGLYMPNGVAMRNGDLYVAEVDHIGRYEDIENQLQNPPNPVTVFDNLPSESHHGWKYTEFGPDGWLYVPVGAPCNICNPEDSVFATLMRIRPDGSQFQLYAEGIRNTVGYDWHPQTGELWFTDNGRDWMGDNKPPDELNRITEPRQHFGYPFCHGGDLPDPEYGDQRDCSAFVPPVQKLGPHVAALGMLFYSGDMFPAEYQNQVLIPEHGSWNRSTPIGYRVTLVRLGADGEALAYEPFVRGWLEDDGDKRGRPVDLLQLPDGSLLISDDYSDRIYRVTYQG